jgi:hypothetical protein
MSEPIYSFVKGQGWTTAPQHDVIMICGTKVRLEFREPQPGDRYDFSQGSQIGTTAEPNVVSWKRILGNLEFDNLCMLGDGNAIRNYGCYVVCVPV